MILSTVGYGSLLAGSFVITEGFDLTGVDAGTMTPSVLLGITVLLLLTGKIVHVSALEREREQTRIWKSAYDDEKESRKISDSQVGELLDYAKATDLYIKQLAASSSRQRDEG